MTTVLDDAASGAASTATDIPSIDTTTHWYHDPTRALGPHIVEILTRTPFVLVLAYYVGKMFAKARLPRISGYLVTGVMCGSHVLGVLSVDATRGLAGLDNLCLALIGVAAGSELHLADLRRSPKPTLVMTASITVFSWVFVFVTFMFVGRGVEFIGPGASTAHLVAVASFGGDARGGEVARVGDRGVEGDGRERAVLFARDVGHGGEGRAGGGYVRGEPGARRGGGAGFFGGRRSPIRSIFDGDGRARGVHAPGVQRRDVRGARGHGGNRARAAPQTPADANDE